MKRPRWELHSAIFGSILFLAIVACEASASTPPQTELPPAATQSVVTAVPLTASGPQEIATTAAPEAPVGPPALNAANYQSIHTVYTWDVGSDIVRVTGIAISRTASRIALLTLRYKEDYRVEVRDLQGKFIWDAPLNEKAAYPAIAFSPDGTKIIAGTNGGRVQLFDTANGTLIRTLGQHRQAVRVVAFSPDGKLVASGASDNEVRLWRLVSGVEIPTCFYWDPANKAKCRPQNKTDVRDLAFSPDGNYLAVSANVAVILDTSTGKEADRFYDSGGETQDLAEVAFSPDGQGLAASGDWFNIENNHWRKRILIWSFPSSNNQPKMVPLDDALEDLIFSSDGRIMLGSYKDKGLLMAFDIVTREPVAKIDLGPITLMSYSPDLQAFAILANNTSVSIWSVEE